MKLIKKLFLIVIFIFTSLNFTSCSFVSNNYIKADISHNIYEYENGVSKQEVNDSLIQCFLRYKLVFNLSFDLESLKKLNNKSLPIKIKVEIGNDEKLQSENIATGGKAYNYKGNGVYESSAVLSKDTTSIDFEKSFFIIGIDDIDNVSKQPISVSITSEDLSYSILLNQSKEKYFTTLTPIKALYDFNEKDNLTVKKGINVVANNLEILLPNDCLTIKMIFWETSEKLSKYGEVTLSNDMFVDSKIDVVLSDYMKQFIGEAKYNETIRISNYVEVYIEFIAIGNNNYADTSFIVNYKLI